MKAKRIATKMRNVGGRNWYKGSALYRVEPPVEVNDMGFITETPYVICGVTPRAVDHLLPECAVFFARNLRGQLWYKGDYENSAAGVYVPGSVSHARALAKLQGGYTIRRPR